MSTHTERSDAHGSKLSALLTNAKLPEPDRDSVREAIEKYREWVRFLSSIDETGDQLLVAMCNSLNKYKNFIDLELIFNSSGDFLYRQNGQLKLSNSILEEFISYLFDERLVPGFSRLSNTICGPRSSFSGLSFGSPLLGLNTGGVIIKKKDQDFSVAKKHKLTITNIPGDDSSFSEEFFVSHFATEIKTNLDKTMFQEASQTAGELKRAVPGAKYILLCEYLDMTPINTKLTSIDEVIVLRKAKRLPSNIRKDFSSHAGRVSSLSTYREFIHANPINFLSLKRFTDHLNECFPSRENDSEDSILSRGYF